MKELTGRVGCVKTHRIGDNIVQNFALCVEEVVNNGYPRLHTEWHNVVARNLEQVNKGDQVTIIGKPKQTEYIHSDGYTRVFHELVAENLTILKMEINSQICTTREQSERLLVLGLKKETADMIHVDYGGHNYMIRPYDWLPASKVDMEKYIPAWSLHRLIKLVPIVVYSRPVLYLTTLGESVFYCTEDNNEEYEKSFSAHLNLYDNIIDCIEWLIKEGCISKEYIAI